MRTGRSGPGSRPHSSEGGGREIATTGWRGRVRSVPVMFDPDTLVDDETLDLIEEGIPQDTRDTYRREWAFFIEWCGNPDNGMGHPRAHMPATPETVCKFIKDHWAMTKTLADGSKVFPGRYGRPYAPATVELRLSVISIMHQWKGLPSPTRHPAVSRAFSGYEKRWARRGWRPDQAYPLSPEENVAMVRSCDLSTVQGIRNAAMLRLHYELGARANELCGVTFADLDWKADDRLMVHIEFGKGGKTRDCAVEADVDFAPDVCPLVLLRQWMELAGRYGITEGPLFREVNPGKPRQDGRISGTVSQQPIERHAYEMVFNRQATRAKVNVDPTTKARRHVSSHSARAGLITAAVEAGMEIAQIAPHTGHSLESPVIHSYYRQGRKFGQHNPGWRVREARRRKVGDE